MLLCINRACHTAVPPKISRGLPDLSFYVGGKVQTSPAVGFPIIANGKKIKVQKVQRKSKIERKYFSMLLRASRVLI